MSIHEVKLDLDKIVKPLLKEILEKIDLIKAETISEIVETAAAKIISEIINCSYNKDILDILKETPERRLVLNEKTKVFRSSFQYSYPNNSVGNEELGTGKNPNSLTWPFESKQ